MAGQPYVTRLGDGRYLAVELPEGEADVDPVTGELILQPPAIRLLDQLRTLLSPLPPMPTPGRLRLLREGLNISLEEFAALVKVAPTQVIAWENGQEKPAPENLQTLEEVRQRSARAGIVLPVRVAG